MKILVTGGCGFIGTNLIRELLGDGNRAVVNVDKLSYASSTESLAEFFDGNNYAHVRADIANAEAVDEIFASAAPDAVIHLAAESHVDRSIDGPAPFVQSNIVGTFHLLDAALRYFRSLPPPKRALFRFLHISTDEVYGSLGTAGRFTESSPYAPHSPYAATKAASDHLVRAWATTYGLPVVITNSSNNFGPYQFPEKLVPLMIIKCIAEEPLPLYGRGANIRDWLYVQDHVRAILAVLERGKLGETYNVGANNELSNLEMVRYICQIMDELHPRSSGRHAELITPVNDRPGHDFRYAIDASKLKRDLDWKAAAPFESSLRQTVRWYLDNRDWWRNVARGVYEFDRLGLPHNSKVLRP